MDQVALLSLLQTGTSSSLCVPEERIYVDSGQSTPVCVGLGLRDSDIAAGDAHSALKEGREEREICPLTELCTVQVLTISLKDDSPEVNEVTIPDALASSLRFGCKLCDKTFKSFIEFDTHVKTHTPAVEEVKVDENRVASPDSHPNLQDDSVDNFDNNFSEESTEVLLADSTQIEAIAEGLIGLSASPQRQQKSGDADCDSGSVESERSPVYVPPEEVTCYRHMSCSVCDSVFSDEDLWEDHIRKIHLVSAPFQCVVCGKELNGMPLLRGHVIKVHRKFSQMICEKQWNKRKKNVHGPDLTPCSICCGSGKSDPDQLEKCEQIIPESDMYVLRRKQNARTQVSCKLCGKVLARDYMRKHMNLHAGIKPHKCQFCGKFFAERAQLKRHESTHTNDKPFKCDICGQNFTASTSLTRHMNLHTGEKKFQCSLCDKLFVRRASLYKHAQTHAEGDGASCSVCGQTFTLKRHLMKHLRNVHMKSEPELNFD